MRIKETAEEQLLRMIEGRGPTAAARPPLKRLSPQYLLEQGRERFGGCWRWLLPPRTVRESADGLLWRLHVAERIAWVILTGLAVYLVVDLVLLRRHPPRLSSSFSPAERVAVQGGAEALPADPLKSAAEYRQAIVTRNPFRTSASGPVEERGVKSRLQELTSTLSVVGINRGRIPEALIEDTDAKRTYFIKVGEELNGLMITSIDERGVTVRYEDEETLLP